MTQEWFAYALLGQMILFYILWLWRERHFNKERRELLDRLMARSYAEYKSLDNVSQPTGRETNPIKRAIDAHKVDIEE